MLSWSGYPTHPHDQQHYGSASTTESYGFPAVSPGENGHTPSSGGSEYGTSSYASLDVVHQEAPCHSQLSPVEATSQSFAGGDAMASEGGVDAQYSHPYEHHPYQEPAPPVSPQTGYYPPLAHNFIDPQLYYGYGNECPSGLFPGYPVTNDACAMRSNATLSYSHRYIRQNSRFVPHLELHDPTHHATRCYSLVSPTESTYSELRNALSEPPISPVQRDRHAQYSALARSPVASPSSDVESVPYASSRPSVSRSSSELLHALDESQVRCPSRLSGIIEPTCPSTVESTSRQTTATPSTEDPPGETNPIRTKSKRAESPPMDHLPWPPEIEGTRKAQSADATTSAGSSRPTTSPQDSSSPRPVKQELQPPLQRRAQSQQTTTPTTPGPTPFQFIQDGSAFPFQKSPSPLPFPIVTSAPPTSTDGLRIAPAPPSPEDEQKALQLVHRSELAKDRRRARKKPAMACLFCRERKIACGPPVPGSNDPACNQCARRNRKCEYPTECRRGQHKRGAKPAEDQNPDPDPDGVGDAQPGASTSTSASVH